MEFLEYLVPESDSGLVRLNLLLHFLHLALIGFILFGWCFKQLVPAHSIICIIIWFSWLGLGLCVHYLGYCPLTDLHWRVKSRLAESNLPPSYIEYWYTKITSKNIDDGLIANITAAVMLAVTIISTCRFFQWHKARKGIRIRNAKPSFTT